MEGVTEANEYHLSPKTSLTGAPKREQANLALGLICLAIFTPLRERYFAISVGTKNNVLLFFIYVALFCSRCYGNQGVRRKVIGVCWKKQRGQMARNNFRA